MLNPAGTFSFAVGNLSGAAGIGGGAFGASLAAASLPAGRPINGDPGGSAGAAAAGAPAAGGAAAGCWAAAPSVKALRKAPASNRLRGVDGGLIMGVSPLAEACSLHAAHEGADAGGFPDGNLRYFSAETQPERCVAETTLGNGRPDADRLHRASVLRNRGTGGIEDRF